MKLKNFSRFLSLTVSFQLMISPVVAVAEEKKTDGSQVIGSVLTGIAGIGNSILQSQQMMQGLTSDKQMLMGQTSPVQDEYFSSRLHMLTGLPGFNPQDYTCDTLPTGLVEVSLQGCRTGIVPAPPGQLGQDYVVGEYVKIYTDIATTYTNASKNSNVGGQRQGTGCMEDSLKRLEAYFRSRLDQIDKAVSDVSLIEEKYKNLGNNTDLNKAKELTALLDGGNADFVNEAKAKNPDLFDLSDDFGDPACKSIDLGGRNYNDIASKGGLNSINKQLSDTLNTKQGNYSGASFTQAYPSVITEINQMADRIAKQIEMNFSELDKSNYKDKVLGFSDGADNKYNLASKIVDQQAELVNKQKKLLSNVAEAGRASPHLSGLAQNALNLDAPEFDSNLAAAENDIKMECFRKAAVSAVKSIYIPSASDYANKQAAESFHQKFMSKITGTTSLEDAIAEIKNLEQTDGNRYALKLNDSYSFKTTDANGKITTNNQSGSAQRAPSIFFTDMARHCETQFKASTVSGKTTAASAIQKIKQARTEYINFSKSHAQDVKNQIKKRLIECSDSTVANGQVQASCSPASFNTSSSGFCANAARACATNMQQCSKKAEQKISQYKNDRSTYVNNFNVGVERDTANLADVVLKHLDMIRFEAEKWRAAYGAGFTIPELKTVVPNEEMYMEDLKAGSGGALMVKDPMALVKLFKSNMDQLKKSMVDQQQQIMGDMRKHIDQTNANYKEVLGKAEGIIRECQGKYDAYVSSAQQAAQQQSQKMMEDQNKRMQKLGEHQSKECSLLRVAQTNPLAVCDFKMMDFIEDGSKVGYQPSGNLMSLFDMCSKSGRQSSSDSKGNEISQISRANQICADINAGRLKTEDQEIIDICKARVTSFACSQSTENGKTFEQCGSRNAKIAIVLSAISPSLQTTNTENGESEIKMPANCVAADTSDRGSTMDTIFRGLNQAIAPNVAAPR